ncbi:hypothetical protein DMUE_6101, partial [Dictyocoela muelleri]
ELIYVKVKDNIVADAFSRYVSTNSGPKILTKINKNWSQKPIKYIENYFLLISEISNNKVNNESEKYIYDKLKEVHRLLSDPSFVIFNNTLSEIINTQKNRQIN